MRKGPAVADRVTIRHRQTLREREIARTAIPFFPEWDVLTSDGRRNPNPATTESKGN